jgi:hypothetical protein
MSDREAKKRSKSMRFFESKLLQELLSAPGYGASFRVRAFKWACLIGFVLVGGCSTTDTNNTSPNPWNRPTKADVSKGWWPWFEGQYWDAPGGHYP